LEKDVNRRLHDIADARIELEEAIAGSAEDAAGASGATPASAARAPSRRAMFLALTGTALGAAAIAVFATSALHRAKPQPSEPTRRFVLGSYDLMTQSAPVFSPDGETIVFSGRENGMRRLFRRSLAETEAVAIPGTEEGTGPFFSPDGQWIGFTTGKALKRVPFSGGSALTICNEPNINSADWTQDGTIYFTPLMGGADRRTALARISEAGGRPERVAEIDSANGEMECWLPEVLPGDEWALVTSRRSSNWSIHAIPLKGGTRRLLLEGGALSRYVPPNFLVVVDATSQATVAFPFDARRVEITGSPVPLTGEIDISRAFDVSRDGKLVYVPIPGTAQNTIVWVNREGGTSPLLETQSPWTQPRLSPDGRHLLVRKIGYPNCDLWMYETGRRALTRVTHEDDSHDPILSPDGRRVAFSRQATGSSLLSLLALDGSGPVESLGAKTEGMLPSSWSHDGRFIVATVEGGGTGSDVWIVPVDGAEPTPYLNSEARESGPAISPDGKWIAYTSDESGRREIYVRPNPGPGPRVQVSTEGGQSALWTRGGKEIVFTGGEKMMASSFAPGPDPRVGVPVILFTGNFSWSRQGDYDVLPDGSRFVMVQGTAGISSRSTIWVTLNWPAELTRTHSTRAKAKAKGH
jgi:serine/threonine-protein kinase